MKAAYDIAVVGSGFAGSLFALIARRLGRTVVLIEKGAHPRFAIGESSSPLANLMLEDLCRRYDLRRIAPLSAWGSWQRERPEIGCGLKRGFTFYGHPERQPFARDPERRDQLLVAASPRDEVADTHWFRADFDHFLVREAQAEGVEYFDRVRLERCVPAPSGRRLEGTRLGQPFGIEARLVIDGSGPRGFLHRALALPEAAFPMLPRNEGLYAHFEGVRRTEEMADFAVPAAPPYPPDAAALHHVFDGGWIWVLRFRSGIVSAGVAAQPRLAREIALSDGAPAWERLLSRLPSVAAQFAEARPVQPFVHAPLLPFRAGVAAGEGWALLPSAAAFIDPLLSTGIPLALSGIDRLIRAVETEWGRSDFDASLTVCAAATLRDADSAALLVSALYASFSDFELFAALALLYFAAASFSEAARRVGRPEMAASFLCADHPVFGPAFRSVCESALDRSRPGGLKAEERRRLLDRIDAAIAPLDVAGLRDARRRNWHPVEAEPFLAGAEKLGVSRARVEMMLRETGFFEEEPSPQPRDGLRAGYRAGARAERRSPPAS